MLDSRREISSNQTVLLPIFKILLIVRPSRLVDLLKLELSHEGYDIEVVHDGMSGLLKCRQIKPHLVILDWQISRFSAADLCCRLHSDNHPVSVIVLDCQHEGDKLDDIAESEGLASQTQCAYKTSGVQQHRDKNNLAAIEHRVAALDAGADDCISTPFALNEFLARIRVQLRKHITSQPSVLMFEDLRLDTLTREVYRGDRFIYLTTKEFALLEYLLSHPRQVLTRTQIIERVWDYHAIADSNIIEVYIRYLRLKLEKNNSKRLIYTVRSVGYVLRESSFN